MPLWDFVCDTCGKEFESTKKEVLCCGKPMRRKIGLPAFVKIQGQGYPSRRKWMDNWTPDSPPFPVSSIHGEKK